MAVIGILGGAFNPPHKAHTQMAEQALKEGIDKVVFLPSNNPPHKSCPTSFDDRVNMLRLLTGEDSRFEVCTLEGEEQKVHYTCETVGRLKEIYGDIVYIIGGDSLIDLHKWKNPEEVIKQVKLFVFPRADRQQEFEKALGYWKDKGADIQVADRTPQAVSSTCVRYLLSMDDTRYIDEKVAEYIKEKGLYREFADKAAILREQVMPHTYLHIARTAECALRLNFECGLNLDNDKVFLAAMLHDCAKLQCKLDHDTSEVPQDSVGSAVEHQFYGKVLAKSLYGVTDSEVLDAIESHCTGKPDMTTLDKLIYCADMLEDARDFEGVDELRKSIRENFEKGFVKCLLKAYAFVKEQGGFVYPLTQEAVDYYTK